MKSRTRVRRPARVLRRSIRRTIFLNRSGMCIFRRLRGMGWWCDIEDGAIERHYQSSYKQWEAAVYLVEWCGKMNDDQMDVWSTRCSPYSAENYILLPHGFCPYYHPLSWGRGILCGDDDAVSAIIYLNFERKLVPPSKMPQNSSPLHAHNYTQNLGG